MKYRKTLLLFIATITILPLFSQDIIEFNDGRIIEVKVLELNTKEIKYKLDNSESSPTYSVLKSDVYSITYDNGHKDYFEKIINTTNNNKIIPNSKGLLYFNYKYYINSEKVTSKEFQNVLIENYDAYSLYFHGMGFRNYGILINVFSAVCLNVALLAWVAGIEINPKTFLYSGIGMITGGIIEHIGNTQMSRAVQIYNNETNKTAVKFGINNNGLGIAYFF